MPRLRVVVALLLLACSWPAGADAPAAGDRPLWTVPQVGVVPAAAALAAGETWPQASCLTGLIGLTSGQLSRLQPRVWLARDGARLYLAWRLPRLPGQPLVAAATERDGAVWNDDALEVFLDPGHTHRDYFQYIVNSRGTLYDSRGRDAAFTSAATVTTAVTESAWAGVLAVPFAELGSGAPPDGTLWGLNLALDRSPGQRPSDGWQPEEGVLVWSPVAATLHEPQQSGHVLFLAEAPLRLSDPGVPHALAPPLAFGPWQGTSTLTVSRGAEVVFSGAATTASQCPPLQPGAHALDLQARQGDRLCGLLRRRFTVVPPLELRLASLTLRQELEVDARLHAPRSPDGAQVQLSLATPSGKLLRQGVLQLAGTAPMAPLRWSVKGLPPGRYAVRAAVGDLATQVDWQLPPRPLWLGSAAGKIPDSRVLRPFTPLRVLSRRPLKLGCWGRTITLTGGGLPASIVAGDRELLAAPARWVAVANGTPVVWQSSGVDLVKHAAGAIEYVATQTGGGVTLQCRGRLEFDGFLRLDCSVRSTGRPVRLDHLHLQLPYRREVARLMHHFPRPSVWQGLDMKRFNARAVPAAGWQSQFLYFVWVGDEERGLQWLTDSDEYWRPADPAAAIALRPDRGAVVLDLDLVGTPVRLDRPRPYHMVLQASPVRPTPPNYREWRYAQVGYYGMEKAPYRWPAEALRVDYPAAGLFPLAAGTVEITVVPHFDSLAPGEANRNLFQLCWPQDRRQEPTNGFWVYWNQDDRGPRLVARQGGKYQAIFGAKVPWKPGEPHTIACRWGENGTGASLFVDRRQMAAMPAGCVLQGVDLTGALLSLGVSPCDFTIRQWRLSNALLAPEQLGTGGEPLAPLPSTVLLDRFERVTEGGEGRRVSVPAAGPAELRGEVREGVQVTAAGLDLSGGDSRRTLLDTYRDQGLRTIGFHEHWTDWQGFPYTSHTAALRSLVKSAHERDLRLILYHSWQLANTAPECPLYLRECEIVDPGRFLYTREPKQLDYPVCARSPWADFMVDGMKRNFAAFGADGIYSDGFAYPGECANTLHGCGYRAVDGTIHPTYNLFAVRDAVKRAAAVLEDLGKPTLFVCHTSGQITLPTLSFCDAYLDAEHLTGQPRPFRLPLDAFRAEFMGHNFGLPAYFLVYDWNNGMTTPEGLALALLHDTEVPWSFEAMAPVWNLWSEFGVAEARFLPYWQSAQWLREAPAGVQVSMYLKDDGDALVVAANLSEQPTQGAVRLKWPVLSAREALGGQTVGLADGALSDEFPVWRARLYRAKVAK